MIVNTWQDIIGHEQIKQDLQILVAEKKLPHALLFAGIDGIGKKLVAKILAKTLLCNTHNLEDNCTSCRAFANEAHPDFYYLKPDGKMVKTIKIEQIRKMQESISLSPYLSDKRVVIIDGAESMNEVATNSLLKILEEPIGQVYFILLSANKEKLLPTILSRCMKLYFAPLSANEVTAILAKTQNIDEQKAQIIAKLSGGSIKNALNLLTEEMVNLRDKAVDFLTALISAKKIWSLSEELSLLDREAVKIWALHLQMMLRDLLVLKANNEVDDELLYNSDLRAKLQDGCEVNLLFKRLNLVDELIKKLDSNADVKLMLQKFMLQWRNKI